MKRIKLRYHALSLASFMFAFKPWVWHGLPKLILSSNQVTHGLLWSYRNASRLEWHIATQEGQEGHEDVEDSDEGSNSAAEGHEGHEGHEDDEDSDEGSSSAAKGHKGHEGHEDDQGSDEGSRQP